MNALNNPIVVPMTVASNNTQVGLKVQSNRVAVGIGVTCVVVSGLAEHFIGEYEYTPTTEEQIVSIKDKVADGDIIINPIPKNYGLITWNGSTLTVS